MITKSINFNKFRLVSVFPINLNFLIKLNDKDIIENALIDFCKIVLN